MTVGIGPAGDPGRPNPFRRLDAVCGLCADEIDLEPSGAASRLPHCARVDRLPGERSPGRDADGRASAPSARTPGRRRFPTPSRPSRAPPNDGRFLGCTARAPPPTRSPDHPHRTGSPGARSEALADRPLGADGPRAVRSFPTPGTRLGPSRGVDGRAFARDGHDSRRNGRLRRAGPRGAGAGGAPAAVHHARRGGHRARETEKTRRGIVLGDGVGCPPARDRTMAARGGWSPRCAILAGVGRRSDRDRRRAGSRPPPTETTGPPACWRTRPGDRRRTCPADYRRGPRGRFAARIIARRSRSPVTRRPGGARPPGGPLPSGDRTGLPSPSTDGPRVGRG